ncbi:hypothetical protein [Rhodococcus opacus]|nr:hypothetical protein [Rhodococcus opacus]
MNAIRDIEDRLYEQATHTEQALLHEYVRASRRGTVAVVAMGHNMVIANPAASRLMDSSDQVLLWDWATRNLEERLECASELRFMEGIDVHLHARRVGGGKDTFGVVVELRPKPDATTRSVVAGYDRSTGGASTENSQKERLPGRSLPTCRLQMQLDELRSGG